MIYHPGGMGEVELTTIILDLNGTLAVKGKIVEGAESRITALKEMGFDIHLFTGDQRGNATTLASQLGIQVHTATSSEEKQALTEKLSVNKTVAIGNARIDIGTFKPCKLRIGTIQLEGIHTDILEYIDILVPSINDALDLLIDESTFNATMRK